MSLNTRNKEKYNLCIKIYHNHKNIKKNIKTFKRVNSKPILNYMKPNYYSKASIDFNYFLPNKTYFTNQLIKLNYTSTRFY